MSASTNAIAARAWEILAGVADPEIPVVSVVDLGIVREVRAEGAALEITVTPTYSGCPATQVIEASIRRALADAGLDATVRTSLAPAWTTDWLTAAGREKLTRFGIAPPGARATGSPMVPIRFVRTAPATVACPHCDSTDTERLAEFGSTACKALYRCRACREPFDYFKPL